jgi:hypothetical protein
MKDISKAVKFAADHNIAVSVMSTGHEFQVRPGSIFTRCHTNNIFDWGGGGLLVKWSIIFKLTLV